MSVTRRSGSVFLGSGPEWDAQFNATLANVQGRKSVNMQFEPGSLQEQQQGCGAHRGLLRCDSFTLPQVAA